MVARCQPGRLKATYVLHMKRLKPGMTSLCLVKLNERDLLQFILFLPQHGICPLPKFYHAHAMIFVIAVLVHDEAYQKNHLSNPKCDWR